MHVMTQWVTRRHLAVVLAGVLLLVNKPLLSAIVLAGGAGAYARLAWRDRSRAASWLVLASALPLFVDVPSMRLTVLNLLWSTPARSAAQSGTRFHLAFIAIAILVTVSILRREPASLPRPDWQLVAALGLTFTVSVITGLATGAGPIAVIYYGQTVIPLLAWFCAVIVGLRPDHVAVRVVQAVTVTTAVTVAYSMLHGGLGGAFRSSIALENSIPQYRSYFPALQAIAAAFAITYLRRHRRLAVVSLACTAASLPFMWSRGGLAMIGIAACLAYLLMPGEVLSRRRLVRVAVLGAAGATGVVLILKVGIVGQRGVLSDLSASDSTRIDLARAAVDRIAASPLVGDAFRPYSDQLVGGRTADFARLFPTHNQYFDYGIRGGVLAGLLLIVILALSLWRCVAGLRRRNLAPEFFGGALAGLVAVAAGCFGELYITQTWTGSVVMIVAATASSTWASSTTDAERIDPGLPARSP